MNMIFEKRGEKTHDEKLSDFFDSNCNRVCFLKGHRAQWSNDGLIVSGGRYTKSSEKCTMQNGVFTCVYISPFLDEYTGGVSFIMPAKYCF